MTKEEKLRRANYWLAIIAILREEGFSDVADYVEESLVNEMNGEESKNHRFFHRRARRDWNLNCGFHWMHTFNSDRFQVAHKHLDRIGVYNTLRSL